MEPETQSPMKSKEECTCHIILDCVSPYAYNKALASLSLSISLSLPECYSTPTAPNYPYACRIQIVCLLDLLNVSSRSHTLSSVLAFLFYIVSSKALIKECSSLISTMFIHSVGKSIAFFILADIFFSRISRVL